MRSPRINELNRQLSDALVQYRPEHPTVVGLKQKLQEAQAEPPDLARLRDEERALIERLSISAPPLATAVAAASSTPLGRRDDRRAHELAERHSGSMIIEEEIPPSPSRA